MVEVTEPRSGAAAGRKLRGAWYTPDELVQRIVDAVVTRELVERAGGRPLRVLDPACGDGRFLDAAAARLATLGADSLLVGVDIDHDAVAAAGRRVGTARLHRADALSRDWGADRFDLVIGNPPFLSQMAQATSRGGASDFGGGPYADAAAEFLALAARLVEPDGGRAAFVLPQSILSARDAGAVRDDIDGRAELIWSWWTDERVFDAGVYVCALAFEFGRRGTPPRSGTWSHVVTERRRIPELPQLAVSGTLGSRARLNANFRDEYYGMVAAVGDHATGPPLVTSGLIDPGVNRWGDHPVRFARRRFAAPRVDVATLEPWMQRWAAQRLVPKVLVANQTRIVEAVCDPDGEWLPAVPVVAAYPAAGDGVSAWRIAAVLTSPTASAWAWHRSGGTGMSADTIRLGPVVLAELPWPTGPLDAAVDALRGGDVRGCAGAVDAAYGVRDRDDLRTWWEDGLARIEARRAGRVPTAGVRP